MRTNDGQTIFLKDYQPPKYLVEHVDLEFKLDPTQTQVRAKLQIKRNKGVSAGTPMTLDGDDVTLQGITIDAKPLAESDYVATNHSLTLKSPPTARAFNLEIETIVDPVANTKLMGLYQSSGVYCTQCEADGFRRITYFPDRPDVLATYTTRIEASKSDCPVLLGNGNPVKKGRLSKGRHYAVWHDPHPKPSYLFALVAGDLGKITKRYVTSSGRKVSLAIYVEKGKESRANYAMDSLVRSMRWDENVFGCEYDLDVFNIVAVSDFNMGAMENKGLNIFNDKYVLADEHTATDADFANIEAIIAHEYFHNWTGNRITCRDWFQLCLKEGLTVYRDQEFSSDQRDRSVKRIADVVRLKTNQFPEDAGPLAHSVRPNQYREINNFYTATVYEKGAEIIRVLKALIGDKAFARGIAGYLKRYDGTAATIEQFIGCFEKSSKSDLDQFSLWYEQAGTPVVSIKTKHDRDTKRYTIEFEQSIPPTPGQSRKKPMVIPLSCKLFDQNGEPLATPDNSSTGGEFTTVLNKRRQKILYKGVEKPPVLSVNRAFSSPINLDHPQPKSHLRTLAVHDDDPYNQWASFQTLLTNELKKATSKAAKNVKHEWDNQIVELFAQTISNERMAPAFKAQLLQLPTENELSRIIGSNINPDAITDSLAGLRQHLGRELEAPFSDLYAAVEQSEKFSADAQAAGKRALRNRCLDFAASANSDWAWSETNALLKPYVNMNDRSIALSRLVAQCRKSKKIKEGLEAFYEDFAHEPLVLDKWFSVQAGTSGYGTASVTRRLLRHSDFKFTNPNRVRSVLGAFASNLSGFNAADGSGYRLMSQTIAKLDHNNPQVAARLLTAFRSYRSMESNRRRAAHAALMELASLSTLSRDTADILTRTLK